MELVNSDSCLLLAATSNKNITSIANTLVCGRRKKRKNSKLFISEKFTNFF